MYAIRSYYGYLQIIIETSENSELENISAGDKIKFKPYLKDHNEKLNKKNYFNKQIISNVDVKNNRITSYNVCYTKLLRS